MKIYTKRYPEDPHDVEDDMLFPHDIIVDHIDCSKDDLVSKLQEQIDFAQSEAKSAKRSAMISFIISCLSIAVSIGISVFPYLV